MTDTTIPRRRLRLLARIVFGLALLGAIAWAANGRIRTGTLGDPMIFLPGSERASAAIFLFSDMNGWDADEDRAAFALQKQGAIVMGVDLPTYLATLEARTQDQCLYLVSDIERLSHEVQRDFGASDYRLPIIAGRGDGGAVALAIAAQTPASTLGGTVAVDPPADIPLERPLCTPADHREDKKGEVYMLTKGPLPDPVTVVLTSRAPEDGRQHADLLRDKWPAIHIRDFSGAAIDALTQALKPAPDPLADGPLAGLPLTLLDAQPAHDAMALVLSGDGGWRDLDKTIAENLQKQGIPTAGLDALRYFWTERTPEETAADLSRILDELRKRWKVSHVALIGYSFGADVLPAAIRAMDKPHQDMLTQVSLLGLSEKGSFQISVGGWLGLLPSAGVETLPDLQAMDLSRFQCFYGRDESDSACPALSDTKAELIETSGGHHFDGNYARLADDIVAGLKRRAE